MKIEATKIIQYPGKIFRLEYRINQSGEIFTPYRGWHKMSTHLNRDGYENIYLSLDNGDRKCFKVHRLVMNTFKPIENSDEFQVNHINGIKTDNRIENLEWCTRSENVSHAFRIGLETNRGEENPRHKLTESEVIEICEELTKADRLTYQQIADIYNVTKGTISNIYHKRTWGKITNKYNFN